MSNPKKKIITGTSRRTVIKGAGVAAAAAAFPYVWLKSHAAKATEFHGTLDHLIYVRLSGGFRFTTAFNSDVNAGFNPWGLANNVASGCEWGVNKLLESATWLDDAEAGPSALGMKRVPQIANDMTVLTCVDHEPLAGSADGNHQTGLERWYTGYVNGPTGIFTFLNYGLRNRVLEAQANGETILPAIIMGGATMGRGSGKFAPYRPPVMSGNDLDRFGFNVDELLPTWAQQMTHDYDVRFRAAQSAPHYAAVDAYMQTREATKAYAEIFNSEALKIQNGSQELFDGISNAELEQVFGDDNTARNIRLALRLFHYGCPAVYMDQGGYDYHSGEEEGLPGRTDQFNRFLSGLNYALKKMEHPKGGTYWDRTMVVFGSEFSRTVRGQGFNSARGSDHGGDYETRWMSMPFMGGSLASPGAQIGETRKEDLKDLGKVFSYRATMLTLMDALGCEFEPEDEVFPTDEAFTDLFV